MNAARLRLVRQSGHIVKQHGYSARKLGVSVGLRVARRDHLTERDIPVAIR